MRIIAYDPSSKNTGYAVMQDKDDMPYIIESGALSFPKPKKDTTFEEKCLYVRKAIHRQLIEWKPDLVVIEYPFVGRNASTAVKLGRLAGMIEATCDHNGISYMMVLPKVWKSAFTGNGNADKELVMDYVGMYYDIGVASNDESDAIAIGHYYLTQKRIDFSNS